MKLRRLALSASLLAASALFAATPGTANAHCDTMAGPVVSAGRQALDSGNVNFVLAWVQPNDETAIRTEFDKARAARQAGGQAKDDADRHFFESLVRIHRAGEGAPYTGIKPEGAEVDAAVTAADRALESGTSAELQKLVGDAVQSGIQKHFQAALERRRYDANDVAAGRAYVKSYVEFTHYVEGLHQVATSPAHHDHEKAEGHAGHDTAAHAGHDTAAHAEHAKGDGNSGDGDHSTTHGSADHAGHSGHGGHLPWILVVVLGLALAGETGYLVTRKRRD